MAITLKCPKCEKTISAKDEDDLLSQVQEHVSEEHDLPVELPRKHILARLRQHQRPPTDEQ